MKYISLLLSLVSVSVFAGEYAPRSVTCFNKDAKIKLQYFIKGSEASFEYARGTERAIGPVRPMNDQGTILGSLVTVPDEKLTIVDAQYASVSLIMPDVNLIPFRSPEPNDEVFDTMVVETISKTSFAGPSLVRGVIQDSKYFPVKCRAER